MLYTHQVEIPGWSVIQQPAVAMVMCSGSQSWGWKVHQTQWYRSVWTCCSWVCRLHQMAWQSEPWWIPPVCVCVCVCMCVCVLCMCVCCACVCVLCMCVCVCVCYACVVCCACVFVLCTCVCVCVCVCVLCCVHDEKRQLLWKLRRQYHLWVLISGKIRLIVRTFWQVHTTGFEPLRTLQEMSYVTCQRTSVHVVSL